MFVPVLNSFTVREIVHVDFLVKIPSITGDLSDICILYLTCPSVCEPCGLQLECSEDPLHPSRGGRRIRGGFFILPHPPCHTVMVGGMLDELHFVIRLIAVWILWFNSWIWGLRASVNISWHCGVVLQYYNHGFEYIYYFERAVCSHENFGLRFDLLILLHYLGFCWTNVYKHIAAHPECLWSRYVLIAVPF